MSYEKLRQAFLAPADEYSPMPFWFWNDTLTEAEITRQIEDFQAHGVAGFVLHPRKGLPGSIPYLSTCYMHYVRHAVDEAARRGMRVVLYDEAMYPSGAAHGLVAAENPAWASRCLWMEQHHDAVPATPDIVAACAGRVTGDTVSDVTLLDPAEGAYAAPRDGRMLLVFREGFSGGTIRGIHEEEDDGEARAPRSADLLNPEAVQAFIRITHERYYEVLHDHFGKTVIAMFTDEPDIKGRNARPDALAWTQGFLAEFGDPALLPFLFLKGREDVRRHYRQRVNQRMVRTYYQPLASWCASHGVALTGHPAKGYDIGLLKPFQLPGQDVVWRFVDVERGLAGEESVLAKCSADSARHRLRRRNANECFGCCGPSISQWAMTPADMKWYMDYLFVRGVNLLFPHAFYYSIRDGRGDERPPDAGPHNAWWPEYHQISTYMRRLSWLMTDSVNQARIAVLCEGDRMPVDSVAPLYEQQLEFNYLECELLSDCRVDGGALCIARQRYTHVLPGDVPLTAAQAALLSPFVQTPLPRDLVAERACPDLRVSHVVKEGVHFYLLVNEGGGVIATSVRIPVAGRARWWNAWDGSITDAARVNGAYPVHLPARESLILCVDPAEAPVDATCTEAAIPVKVRPALWHLTRADGVTATLAPDGEGRLPGWETLPGWEVYSGSVVYEAAVDFAPGTCIDLGEVHEIARVSADGKPIGTRLWGPYVFRLAEGATLLRVEVANTPAGMMDGVSLPSGLLG
ncbi:MAG: hypothetical protein PUC00_08220 [Clostridiales bacterium]|nr:hypothetical protein [Clostridiales bacterium]